MRIRAIGWIRLSGVLIQVAFFIVVFIMVFGTCGTTGATVAQGQPEKKSAIGSPPLATVVQFTMDNIYDCAHWNVKNYYVGINCVDYAILFWSYCGGHNNPDVRVMRCKTPAGFDHLYIKWYGYEIEPTTGDPIALWWKYDYDARYTEDVTEWCTEVALYVR